MGVSPLTIYAWFTNNEGNVFWQNEDTVWGRAHSNGNVHIAGSPVFVDKITSSNVLTLTMNANGGLNNIVQEGNFRYVEAAAKKGEAASDATAQKATYDPQTEMFVLTGEPQFDYGRCLYRMDRKAEAPLSRASDGRSCASTERNHRTRALSSSRAPAILLA